MKRIINLLSISVILIVATLVALAMPAPNTGALVFTFSYDFAGNPDLSNFFLYYGTSSSNYTGRVSMGISTNYTLAGLQRNTVYFCNMTASSTNGVESDFSTEQAIRTFNKPRPIGPFNVTQ